MSDTHVKCQGLQQLSKYRPHNHRPGFSPVFICQVGRPAVLGQHSPWIKLISGVWHQVAACNPKLFFYDKSTDSLNRLHNLWACRRVLHQPQTCDNDDTSPLYIPHPDFPGSTCFTYFWIKDTHHWCLDDNLAQILSGEHGSNNKCSLKWILWNVGHYALLLFCFVALLLWNW